jgi:hypothetical protein
MKAQTLLTKAAAGLGTVALALAMSACSHTTLAESAGQTTGEIRTEQAAQQQPTSSGQILGTAPAPANAQGITASSTPAIISGPAAVDSTGRVYTSSSVGSAGNAAGTGLNTNVNIVPKPAESTVVVTQTPAPIVTTTTVETAPAPVIVETPAPAPVVVETPAPMTSSTIETPAPVETHRRLRKD